MKKNKIIVISGPTASGKSNLAICIAKKVNGIIINADSMQIYNGLPILSAQPNQDDLRIVEHRLYNYLQPNESNSVFNWLELVKKNIEEVFNKNMIPILVGGTGMYISRFIDGIKPLPNTDENLKIELNNLYNEIGWNEFYNIVKAVDEEGVLKIKQNDKQRLIRLYEIYKLTGKNSSYFNKIENKRLYDKENIFHINLMPSKEDVYNSCNIRFKIMLEKLNVIDEVKIFLNKNNNISKINNSMLHTIGLLEIIDYLNNKITYEEMFEKSVKNTRNYAKRQFTWFKNQFKNLDFLLETLINKSNINIIIDDIVKKYENI